MNAAFLILIVLTSLSLTGCGASDRSPVSETGAANSTGGQSEGHEESEGEGERNHVKLTPEQIKSTGIGLAQVGPGVIRERLTLYGVIAPNAENVREVAARFPGVIRNVTKRVGEPVQQGEVLAIVESNESLQSYNVVAPLTGVVTVRNANPGEQTGDKPMFTVADLSAVWVELSLFPRDVAKVRVGQPARVKNAETNLTAEGKVVYVAPFGSSTNQTLTARVLINNKDRAWPPGLYVTAEVVLASASAPLTISNDAVQTLEGHSVVFVQGENGFEARTLQIGRSDGEVSEVLAGLKPGETYATKNSFILKAELAKGEAEEE